MHAQTSIAMVCVSAVAVLAQNVALPQDVADKVRAHCMHTQLQ
jgi:hypothetical protein